MKLFWNNGGQQGAGGRWGPWGSPGFPVGHVPKGKSEQEQDLVTANRGDAQATSAPWWEMDRQTRSCFWVTEALFG